MSLNQQASENLQIIRSLMERSTIYRAISAPTAFVGGVASILMGVWGENIIQNLTSNTPLRPYSFFIAWGLVFALTVGTHLFQLYRDSLQNGESIFSSRHFHAFKCMFPSIFTAGVISVLGIIIVGTSDVSSNAFDEIQIYLTLLWTFFYGMALLSTQTFAPKSIQILGWTFFVASFLEALFLMLFPQLDTSEPQKFIAPSIMALTFGLFHVIYAITVKITEVKNLPEPGSP